MPTVLLVVGVLTGALYFVLMGESALWPRLVTKPVPILCLAIWVARHGLVGHRRFAVLGLLVSSVGDVVLLGRDDASFLGGLSCFFVAHVAYIVGFSWRERQVHAVRALPFFAVAGVMYAVIAPGLGGMAVPVAGYCAIIATMGWRALARVGAAQVPAPWAWVGVVGASLFMVSDGIIAVNTFHSPVAHAGPAIMVTYYLGQLGIAWSMARSP